MLPVAHKIGKPWKPFTPRCGRRCLSMISLSVFTTTATVAPAESRRRGCCSKLPPGMVWISPRLSLWVIAGGISTQVARRVAIPSGSTAATPNAAPPAPPKPACARSAKQRTGSSRRHADRRLAGLPLAAQRVDRAGFRIVTEAPYRVAMPRQRRRGHFSGPAGCFACFQTRHDVRPRQRREHDSEDAGGLLLLEGRNDDGVRAFVAVRQVCPTLKPVLLGSGFELFDHAVPAGSGRSRGETLA